MADKKEEMVEMDLSDNGGPFKLFVNKEYLEPEKLKNKKQNDDAPRKSGRNAKKARIGN